jgi:hypothetical protein
MRTKIARASKGDGRMVEGGEEEEKEEEEEEAKRRDSSSFFKQAFRTVWCMRERDSERREIERVRVCVCAFQRDGSQNALKGKEGGRRAFYSRESALAKR